MTPSSATDPWQVVETYKSTPEVVVARVRDARGRHAVRKEFPKGDVADFRREVEALRRLTGARVAGILDAGTTEQGVPFLVREFVDGPDLRAGLADLSHEQRLEVAVAVVEALEVLHREGLYHGDLKPENVFLASDGARLADFGLAGLLNGGGTNATASGSAFYLPPEALFGWPLDARSDGFSLGVLFYEMFLGSLPDDPAPFYARFPAQPFLDCVPAGDGPACLISLVRRLTAVDPWHRPDRGAEILEALARAGAKVHEQHPAVPRVPENLCLQPVLRSFAALWRTAPAGLRVEVPDAPLAELLRRDLELLCLARGRRLRDLEREDPSNRRPGDVWIGVATPRARARLAAMLLEDEDRAPPCLLIETERHRVPAELWPWMKRQASPQLRAEDLAQHLTGQSVEDLSVPVQRLLHDLVTRSGGAVATLNEWFEQLVQERVLQWQDGQLVLRELDVPWDLLARPAVTPTSIPTLPTARPVLRLMLALGETATHAWFDAMCRESGVATSTALAELRAAGVLHQAGSGWRVDPALTATPEAAEPAPEHRILARLFLDWPGQLWRALRHQLQAGDLAEATALVLEHTDALEEQDVDRVPPLLHELLRALPASQRRPEILYTCARLLSRAGRKELSVELLEENEKKRNIEPEVKRAGQRLLGDCLIQLGRLEEAYTVYQRGYRATRGTPVEGPFVRGLADVALRGGDPGAALSLLDTVHRRLDTLPAEDRVELMAQRALALLRQSSLDEAAVALRQAIPLARAMNHPGALAMLLTNLALVERRRGKTTVAVDVTREALAIQERRGHLHEVAELHRNLGVYQKEALRRAEARHHLRAALELHRALAERRHAGLDLASLGLLALDQGLLEEARAALQQSRAVLADHGEARDLLHLRAAELRLRACAGRFAGLRRDLAELRDTAREQDVREVAADATLLLLERLIGAGRYDEANVELAAADRDPTLAADPRRADRLGLLRVTFRRSIGDEDFARSSLDRLAERVRDTSLEGEALLEAVALEGPPPSADLLSAVERQARLTSNRRQLLEVLRWRGRWHRARGDNHGAASTHRERDEVLESMLQGGEGWSRARVLCAASGLRARGLRRARAIPLHEDSDGMGDNLELLRTFLTINKRLSVESDSSRLLDYLLDTAVSLAGAQRGFLLLEQDGEVEFEGHRSLRGDMSTPEKELSFTFLREALEKGRPIVTSNAGHDPRFRERESVKELDLRSVLCIPFKVDDDTQGALYVDNPIREGAFTEREVELVDALADQAALALRNLRHRALIEAQNQGLTRRVQVQQTELAMAQRQVERESGSSGSRRWIGESQAFVEADRLLTRYAATDLPVLITGESGTGKELAARGLHDRSPRNGQPFVSENCSSIPETLLEAEFFGVRKGAFTGADKDRPGLFELATGGTLFLDEVGDLPPSLQVKLLRVLQEKAVRPLGAQEPVPIDLRVVCATNRDLQAMVADGQFREDLYYRIAAAVVELPPLRDRRDDVGPLARAFLDELNREYDRDLRLDDATVQQMERYAWPGNVRQLQNEVQRCFAIADGDTLEWTAPTGEGAAPAVRRTDPSQPMPSMREIEKLAIEEALTRTDGNKEEAARMLGISRASIYEKVRRYGIEVPRG